jgi:hypothetical protein
MHFLPKSDDFFGSQSIFVTYPDSNSTDIFEFENRKRQVHSIDLTVCDRRKAHSFVQNGTLTVSTFTLSDSTGRTVTTVSLVDSIFQFQTNAEIRAPY